MPRVKRGTHRRASRKKTLEQASGYFLTKSKLHRAAQEAVERGLKFAYVGRKNKKREYRVAVDRPHQRILPRGRHFLQPVPAWPEGRRARPEPQGSGRGRPQGRAGFTALVAQAQAALQKA